jgi:hypothetical protein
MLILRQIDYAKFILQKHLEQLRLDIVSGRLPAGSQWQKSQLASEFGVSPDLYVVVRRISRLASGDRADVLFIDDSTFSRSRSKKVVLLRDTITCVTNSFELTECSTSVK